MDLRLEGKIALVTGASRGIGRAIALAFAREGANLIINATHRNRIEKVAEEIRSIGKQALAIKADVANSGEVGEMVKMALDKFGRIDILVNNAGISPKRGGQRVPVVDMEKEEWDRVLAVNLNGVFNCSQAVIRSMIQNHYGRIVNISSIVAKTGGPIVGAHYAVSKAGIIGFTKVLARELAPYGITVNAVAPGRIITDMIMDVPPEVNEAVIREIPLGRLGKPEEVATVVLFLVSDAASYITGVTIDITGGWMLH